MHENVGRLRRALGSVARALSFSDFAAAISARHPVRQVNSTTVQRWEKDGVEPDIASIVVMAQLAGVSFEAFALGAGAVTPRTALEERAAADPQSLTRFPITVRGVPSESVKPQAKGRGKKGGGAA